MAVNTMMLGQGAAPAVARTLGAGAAIGGPAGLVGAGVLVGLGMAAKKAGEALEAMRRNINEVSDELRPYSADLAAAAARREVGTITQNVSNAGRFGSDLAAFQDSQTRVILELQNMKTSLVGAFTKGLGPGQKETSEKLAAMIGLITKIGEDAAEWGGDLVGDIADAVMGAVENLPWGKDLANALKAYTAEKQAEEAAAGAELLNGFLDMEQVPIGVQAFRAGQFGQEEFWAGVDAPMVGPVWAPVPFFPPGV